MLLLLPFRAVWDRLRSMLFLLINFQHVWFTVLQETSLKNGVFYSLPCDRNEETDCADNEAVGLLTWRFQPSKSLWRASWAEVKNHSSSSNTLHKTDIIAISGIFLHPLTKDKIFQPPTMFLLATSSISPETVKYIAVSTSLLPLPQQQFANTSEQKSAVGIK